MDADVDAVHAARLTAQRLSGPSATTVDEVVGELLAVQAQDPRGMRLAVRARTSGLAASDVDAALNDRRLVVSWLNRGTLHLVRREDFAWLHALTTPQLGTTSARRLEQEGVTPDAAERGVGVVERVLADGPRTREQLREALDVADVPTAGQALVHVLLFATLRGVMVRGPMVGRQHAFVLLRDWLGDAEPVDREVALGELARRYLRGHGPASDRDLARWAGLPLRDARRGLRGITDALVDLGDGLVDLRGRRAAAGLPPPRLLGAFDPVLLGWTSRERIVGRHAQLVTSNGVFHPFALVDGRAVGRWAFPRGAVSLTLLEPVDAEAEAALGQEARDVERFLAS